MPFNGSGTFISLPPPDFPALPFTTILASMFNANMQDIFTNGLTNCLTRDGQSPPVANLPMAGFKFTGIGAGTADTDSAQLGQTLAVRGQVGVVDWDTRVTNGIFEATAASLIAPAANFPPTSELGQLQVMAQGALVNHVYVTAANIYTRQRNLGVWSSWTKPSQVNPNAIINGRFDIWQRGTSQTSSGYGSDDRWNNINNGSTKVHVQVMPAIGSSPIFSSMGRPRYMSRTAVTSVAGVNNFVIQEQKIESVITLEGGDVCVSFWAAADAVKFLGVGMIQNFGTGGAPSAAVIIAGQRITLSTVPTFYSLVFNLPSVLGKTLGSNGDDFLSLDFYFDAGVNFDFQSGSVGQQSGTFDLAQVKVEKGSTPTPFPIESPQQIFSDCQRYYQVGNYRWDGHATAPVAYTTPVTLPSIMRRIPTVVDTNTLATNFSVIPLPPAITNTIIHFARDCTVTGAANYGGTFTADAEI